MRLNIREARRSDAVAIAAIERESFSSPWSLRLITAGLSAAGAHNYVVETEEKTMAGYLFARTVAAETELHTIATAVAQRNRGVASALLDGLIADCRTRGVQTIYLEVRRSNGAALRLYEKFGFMLLRVRKRYYSDTGEDALVLVKRIAGNGTGVSEYASSVNTGK